MAKRKQSEFHVNLRVFLSLDVCLELPYREEVLVYSLFPEFQCKRSRFDLVFPVYKLIAEAHGQHHFQPVTFGGKTKANAVDELFKQQQRDQQKETIAIANGWTYIHWDWTYEKQEPFTIETLLAKLTAAVQPDFPLDKFNELMQAKGYPILIIGKS